MGTCSFPGRKLRRKYKAYLVTALYQGMASAMPKQPFRVELAFRPASKPFRFVITNRLSVGEGSAFPSFFGGLLKLCLPLPNVCAQDSPSAESLLWLSAKC